MTKINKNVIRWVLELYFKTPNDNTLCTLGDFSFLYKVSRPTMCKFLHLFFNLERGYSEVYWCVCTILYKKEDLVLIFNILKSLKDSRNVCNFLDLFLSQPTTVKLLLKYIEYLKLQESFEDWFRVNN